MAKQPKQLEWQIQHHVVQQLHSRGILYQGDQNSSKRGPKARMQAKATGMQAGWPDLVVIRPTTTCDPTTCDPEHATTYIEFKVTGNKLSPAQVALHARLADNGITVYTVTASTGPDAWEQVVEILGL